jgi:lauroyl/myristoyl acyltransferase
MMGQVNRRIGAWVEERPEQWFWFHRRWRRARLDDAEKR